MADDLALVADHTTRLVQTCTHLEDPGAPSLCDGWSRGHVITHVARNAEAIGRLADWAVTGTRQEMYPGGSSSRDSDIEAGAGRDLDALVADLADTAVALAPALERVTAGPLAADEVEMRGGLRIRPAVLPFLRLREVVFHHVDLDAGFTFADVEPDLLRRFVDDAVGRLKMGSRPPAVAITADEGGTWTVAEPAAYVSGSLAGILLWLARRREDAVRAEGPLPDLPRGA